MSLWFVVFPADDSLFRIKYQYYTREDHYSRLLLRRVVSFIKVLDEVNSFADNRVVSFVYKEDGIPSNNTSMEALASD